MPEETVEEQPKPAAKTGGSSIVKMILIVVLALVSSASGGVISFFLISKTMMPAQTQAKGHEGKEEVDVAEILEKGAVVPLEPFVVNLADRDSARYLRIKVSLMVDDKTKVKEVEENQALQLKVRDVILQTLTKKTSQDLIHEEGKNKLREELLEKVAIYFREPKLIEVMFTEFVIQL